MIEVVCGPMFSGKTEELLRRLKRVKIAGSSYIVVKPKIDSRYADEEVGIVTHDQQNKSIAIALDDLGELKKLAMDYEVVAIDEAQFFDEDLYKVAMELADIGKRVIAVGLDLDSMRVPFATMAKLLAVADRVDKINSICMECKQNASYSFRKVPVVDQKYIGSTESYTPLCRSCYNKHTT